MGEIVELEGVSPEYEIGAVTDLNAKHHGPALLFTSIPGYEGRGRVLSCSLSRAARLSSALGFDSSLDAQALVRANAGSRARLSSSAGGTRSSTSRRRCRCHGG